MTEAELIKWLKNESAIRCVLMEVGVLVDGVETTRYLSNKGYVTGPLDTPANTIYSPAISGGISFTESLSLEGEPSLSYGDIELTNVQGDRDSWLNDVWTNRSVQVYIGDATWARSDFYKVFDGVVAGINSRARNKINLKISDKMQRLNTPLSEKKLGGTATNKDSLLPLCFGECHNVTPLISDPANHEYQVHDGAIEDIIEVRDNGVPVNFTKYLATGKFRLSQSPVGTITCSVQGDKPASGYTNNVANIIKRLVKDFGNGLTKFTDADLDITSLTTFAAANPQPVGIYLSDRTNVLEVCNILAKSVGARVAMNRQGQMYLVKLDLSNLVSGGIITASLMVDKSLQVSDLPAVKAGAKVGYCKNWTVQTGLTTGLPEAHISMYSEEWLSSTVTDSAVADTYRLHTEPTLEETMLLVEADAVAEATRRLNMFKVQRKVMRYESFGDLLFEKLGNVQTLKHERFGLSAGVPGQIISIETNWLNPHTTLEVLI